MSKLPVVGGSLLHRFVDESIDYERTGAPIPPQLLGYAAAGGGAMLLAAASVQVWPEPETIADSWFFLVAKQALADFVAVLQVLALPFAIAGVCALAVTGYLALRPRQRLFWHYACATELAVGVASLAASGLVLLAMVLTFLFWLFVASILLALVGAVLRGFE